MDQQPSIQSYIQFFRRRRYQIAWPALAVFLLAVLVAMLLPSTYRSSSTILIEAQQIPTDLVRPTVTTYVEERLQVITQQIMSRARLLEIIDRFGLYTELRSTHALEDIIEKMRADIALEPISAEVNDPRTGRASTATIAFSLAYDGRNPETVQKVASVLASLYLEQNVKSREEQASTTKEFLAEQLKLIKGQIEETSGELANYKEGHLNSLPELSAVNFQTMIRLEGNLRDIDQQLRGLTEKQTYLKGQLDTIHPYSPMVSSTGERVLTPQDQLEVVRTQYVTLKASLSERHPDVTKLKREIEELEQATKGPASYADTRKRLDAARQRLATAQGKFSEKHPDVAAARREVDALEAELARLSSNPTPAPPPREPENPAYVNLATQIKAAELEADSLKRERRSIEAQLAEYQRRLAMAPEVEKDYSQMREDLLNAQARYRETFAKYTTAQVAQGMEEEQKGERFTIIDPAAFPEYPARPNRPLIAVIGLVLGLGSGITFASVMEFADRSFRAAAELGEITRLPVLGVVPLIVTREDQRRRRRRMLTIGAAIVGGMLLATILIHFLVRPVDIIWFDIMRRLKMFLA
jgi:uncharacterized protein involved in exopolysaccharide biosynthesis